MMMFHANRQAHKVEMVGHPPRDLLVSACGIEPCGVSVLSAVLPSQLQHGFLATAQSCIAILEPSDESRSVRSVDWHIKVAQSAILLRDRCCFD